MGSKVDMHIHTDTYTHSTHSVGPEKRYLAYACGATQGHLCLHVLCKGDAADVGESGGHAYMY